MQGLEQTMNFLGRQRLIPDDINTHLRSCRLEPSWKIAVELAARDDARVRLAVVEAVGLTYGPYDAVVFESAEGTQFFRPREGSVSGEASDTVEMPARVLSFSVPRDPEVLAQAIEAIRHAHSYEEPVIYVTEVLASRADSGSDRGNPNRWWNRGFEF